jgi:PAS domain S-box-containing protein
VLEFFAQGIGEPSPEVAAMFATVGGQLALYLERRRREAGESRRLHAALDRTRGYLDAAGALIVVLDGDGRVLMANARACAALGAAEADVLAQDWFTVAVPKAGRAAARAAFAELMAGSAATLEHRLPSAGGRRRTVSFHATPLDEGAGVLLLGQAESAARRTPVAVAV